MAKITTCYVRTEKIKDLEIVITDKNKDRVLHKKLCYAMTHSKKAVMHNGHKYYFRSARIDDLPSVLELSRMVEQKKQKRKKLLTSHPLSASNIKSSWGSGTGNPYSPYGGGRFSPR